MSQGDERHALLRRVCLLKLALTNTHFTFDDYTHMKFRGIAVCDARLTDLKDTFDKDKRILEAYFGAVIQNVPTVRNTYTLVSMASDFQTLYLSEMWLEFLAIARLPQNQDNFPSNLLSELVEDAQRRIGQNNRLLDIFSTQALELASWRDSDLINSSVHSQLLMAKRDRRLVEFDYRPARDNDPIIVHHVIEPNEIYANDGHLYLTGFCLQRSASQGFQTPKQHFDYRLGRIVVDSLIVLEEQFIIWRQRKQYPVHYILSAKLASGGGSRTFEDEVSRKLRLDGRLEIIARTPRLLQAVQRLLRYGGQCEVLGGEEILDKYLHELQEMQSYYK
jgi:WYL domain